MHYEICVSQNGQHFFATHERSLTTAFEASKVYKVLKDKFPKEDGYEISVTRWEKRGSKVDLDLTSN